MPAGVSTAHAAGLPAAFDLRDRGVVTSVKNQSPWGSCWAFGGCGAAEISILTRMGLTDAQFKKKYGRALNLSEKQLNWWTYHHVPESVSKKQAGEGVYLFEENAKDKLARNTAYDVGGTPFNVTSVFSSGIGPSLETGILRYHGFDAKGRPSGDTKADWTLPDESMAGYSFQLTDGNVLPAPAIWEDELDENGQPVYIGYNADATEAIKRELYKGRGVNIVYKADISQPQELESGEVKRTYISEHWAQYVDEDFMPNHAVCAVGWDDNYPVENFNADHQPPGPGAFLIKNSWGTETADKKSHNYHEGYGMLDEQGRHTGYFWLSYYDKSIYMAESFDFLNERATQDMIVGEYDMLQGGKDDDLRFADDGRKKRLMANVYEAPADMRIYAVGADTYFPDTTVRFDVYDIDQDYTHPTHGTMVASRTVTFPYAGYHRINLSGKHKIKKGDYYSVVVTQTIKTGKGKKYLATAPFGYGKKLAKMNGYPYYSKAVVNKGESFFGKVDKNGKIKWTDWTEVIKKERKREKDFRLIEIDNFAIKAFSHPVE